MKKYIAVFEVPDGFYPRFNNCGNADGWFKNDEGETMQASVDLKEVESEGER